MRIFFHAVVLIFILLFNEIDASDSLKKISTQRKSSKKDKGSIDALLTSRIYTPSSSTYSSTSIAHQALHLDGYHSQPPESSHQQSSTEILDLVNKFKFRNGLPPQVSFSSNMIQNDQMQHQNPEYRQEYSEQENIEWLRKQCRNGPLPLPPLDNYASNQLCHEEHTTELVHKPLMESPKYSYTEGGREEAKMLRAELAKFRTLRAPPRGIEDKHIQPEQFQDKRKLKHKQSLRNEDFSDTNTSSEKSPSTSHETDQSTTPGGYQKRKSVNEKATRPTKVSNSRDLISVKSQHPQNPYQDYQPDLTNNNMNAYRNPNHEFQKGDPKQNPNSYYK